MVDVTVDNIDEVVAGTVVLPGDASPGYIRFQILASARTRR
jgi:hypothetical protein